MAGAESFGNMFRVPELKRRILFTLGMLVIYRIGAHIPTPGIDGSALAELFAQTKNTILGFFDMFSGGALSRLTIVALGIMPYITSSIILQLMTIVSPHLERLKKEGEQGQKKITQYTRYGTIGIGLVQSSGIAIALEKMTSPGGALIVPEPGLGFRLMTMLTLTCGTAFLMWLGEQINERGVGNGISLVIFTGIVSGVPAAVLQSMDLMGTGELSILIVLFLTVLMAGVAGASMLFYSAVHGPDKKVHLRIKDLGLIDLKKFADREEAIRHYTEIWVRELEREARLYPEQYFWVHKRWKTRPEDVDRILAIRKAERTERALNQ